MKFKLPQFPIIVFSQGMVFYEDDPVRFATCSFHAYRKKSWFKNMTFVDSSLGVYKVLAAKWVGFGKLWPGLLFLNPWVRVKLEFDEKVNRVSFGTLRKMICNRIQARSHFYYPVSERKKRIQNSKNMKEIIQNLRWSFGPDDKMSKK